MYSEIVDLGKSAFWLILLNASFSLICLALLYLCQRRNGDAWSYNPFRRSFYHEFLNVCQRHHGDGWFLPLLLNSFKPCDILLQARTSWCSTSFDVIQKLYDTTPIWNKTGSVWTTLYRTWAGVMHQLCLAWSKKQSHQKSYVSKKHWGGLHSCCSHSMAHFLIRQHSTATSPHRPDEHRVGSFIAKLLVGVSLPCFDFLICETLFYLCQRRKGDAWSYNPFRRSFYHLIDPS
jgi:hypothetical protein